MALKFWIDEIKNAESSSTSEAQIEPVGALAEVFLPGEKEADVILFAARDQIVSGGVFHFTPETRAAEAEVNRTYKAILTGGNDFMALRAACKHWVEAASKGPAPPVTVSLLEG